MLLLNNLFGNGSSDFSSLRFDFFNITNHVESNFWNSIQFTIQNLGESSDGILQSNISTWGTGESFSDGEWLRQEPLDFSGSLDGQFFFSRQFSHTQNGDDILEGFVILKDFFDVSGDIVVGGTDNVWVHNSGGGFEWVDSWIETQLSDLSRKYGGGVQVGEGGSWGWIGQIIGWDIKKFEKWR